MDVYKAAVPFFLLVLIGLGLIVVFPVIATWLPAHM